MSVQAAIRPTILDTDFRSALRRMAAAGRIQACTTPIDVNLELASVMKKFDGGKALLFTAVKGHDMPVLGNFLASRENCEAAFGVDYRTIREFVGRALGAPQAPELVTDAPVQQNVITRDIDLGKLLPVLHHTPEDSGRFITAGIVVVRDPQTGVYNASYHRLELAGGNRTAIKLDYGRHLRLAFERARQLKQKLPIAICLGTDLSLQYTAATMGSQMPEMADELAVAGGLAGKPLAVCKAITQDLLVPANTEIVLEAHILPDTEISEGPFGEFVGYLSPQADAPVLEVTAVTHRDRPIYHAINGYGRETVMLRKYVLEASLLKVLQAAVPMTRDVEMTAGGLHRFHAVVQIEKTSAMHNGWQRNAMLASFGALKDLDMVIVVDEDIDIRNPLDVEYALATRVEASRDILVMPGTRGHEYVRIGQNGIRAKLGIDATVPFEDKARFTRCGFAPIAIEQSMLSDGAPLLAQWLKDASS
jgi:2,5-furandicarboxylate decarboxylase 1